MTLSAKWRPQAAMVLGGGMGKRMLPLTKDIPKPMVRLKGRTLIDHVLDRIGAAGVARAVVNVHYCADKLEAHVKQRKKPEVLISDERQQLLDTGGGVTKALAGTTLAELVEFSEHSAPKRAAAIGSAA